MSKAREPRNQSRVKLRGPGGMGRVAMAGNNNFHLSKYVRLRGYRFHSDDDTDDGDDDDDDDEMSMFFGNCRKQNKT